MKLRRPEEEIPSTLYSNSDHDLDERVEAVLRREDYFARHAGWDYNGCVWCQDGVWIEEVYRHHSLIDTQTARSAREVLAKVIAKWGSE